MSILWICGALLAREGHGARAGTVIALSAGLKPWGVLGFPLLLLTSLRRDRILSISVAAVGTLLLYAPFFLLGEVGTFRYRWIVGAGTGAALVMEPGTAFGWLPRLVQGAFAMSVGTAVALAARGRSELVVWAPAAAIIAVRLAVDPTAFPYYWLAAQAVLLVAAGWFVGARAPVPALLLVLLAAATFVASTISVVGVSLLLLVVAVGFVLVGDVADLTPVPLRDRWGAVDSSQRPLKPGP